MRKILLALALLLSPTVADAACNGVFNPATICGNLGSVKAPPQAWPTSGSTFGPVGGSTSGDIVTWQGSSGQQLGDSGLSFGTSGATVPQNNGNNFFSGIVSQFFTNITSVFEYHGQPITFPTSGTFVSLSGNNAWTGLNSFTQTVSANTINAQTFQVSGTTPITTVNGTQCGLEATCIISSAIFQGTPVLPSITTSATGVMIGYGATCKLTPSWSSRIEARFQGDLINSATTNSSTTSMYFGTSTAPTSPSAITGTLVNKGVNVVASGTAPTVPFSLDGFVTGLTSGTTYWFDLGIAAGAGTASVNNVACILKEF